MKGIKVLAFAVLLIVVIVFGGASILNAASGLKPYVDSVEQAKEGMTLWQLVRTGGFIMVVLALMSVGALAVTIYSFITLTINNLVPKDYTEKLIEKLDEKKEKAVRSLCNAQQNIITRMVMAGMDKRDKGAVFAREAMENVARQEIGNLWQTISYLSDIATIAPLIGLLGTVLGMIQAFNVIAFQTAVVKPIVLAGGVSKAMVTTAGGLIVAIPAMLFYAYFRSRIRVIANMVESYEADITQIMEKR
ncbi:MotA/TolQ/ExbB proton channel family protein [Candidatus Omnitrophota bacterium]